MTLQNITVNLYSIITLFLPVPDDENLYPKEDIMSVLTILSYNVTPYIN